MIQAYAADNADGHLRPFEFAMEDVAPDSVHIAVESCGVCHSDLSMLHNHWGMTRYPFVPGHEIVGRVAARGAGVTHVKEGDLVGLGWFSSSCMTCGQCMHGSHHLCPDVRPTIVGRFGGFAQRVQASAAWCVPLPEGVNAGDAGPLFCGGITVFNPLVECDVRPTDRVGVIGVGGLGHLAIMLLNKWGCEVTAFTSTGAKAQEARRLGAHRVVDSRDPDAISALSGQLNFIVNTANAPLAWDAYFTALAPKGRLHTVGAVSEPIAVPSFGVIPGQKSLSGSPLGSPAMVADMLAFCARHDISPVTEHFPMSDANGAFAHLHSGKARYRIVLDADF